MVRYAIIFTLLLASCQQSNETSSHQHDDREHHHGDHHSDLISKTKIKSSSLSARSKQLTPRSKISGNNTLITPINVSGNALSVLFALSDYEDAGIVIFGNGRPDIAPADAQTFPFNMADPLVISDSVGVDPTMPSGDSRHMVALFSYMDFEFSTPNAVTHTIRVAMVDVDDMQRGDKLYDTGGGQFQFYDLNSNTFSATRPSNPARISEIELFTDPIRPDLVFYPINVSLDSAVYFNKDSLAIATGIDADVDFTVTQSVVLENLTSNFSADSVITHFNLRQISSDFEETGFQASATVELVY